MEERAGAGLRMEGGAGGSFKVYSLKYIDFLNRNTVDYSMKI